MNKILYIAALAIFSTQISIANLKYDPSQYSQFQKTGECPNCDLSSIKDIVIYGIDAPYNLQKANISQSFIGIGNNTLSNYSETIAVNTNFGRGCYSQANFKNAILINSNFIDTNLTYADFSGANVDGADFSDANLYGSIGINFNKVKSICNAIMPDGSKGKCT
ncbi:pentapeptide repeat-containing protein [Cysteiniphilum litorale]|uniref:pentapeptide repeat-containing protein n=1 Tax=Cysteiniphilum litorale TaxID=2056700 RepID=UPI003F8809FE